MRDYDTGYCVGFNDGLIAAIRTTAQRVLIVEAIEYLDERITLAFSGHRVSWDKLDKLMIKRLLTHIHGIEDNVVKCKK
jgi:hypothetical protein